jgi:hypothetical protein
MTQLGTDFGATPALAATLELTVAEGAAYPGGTVIVPAQVTNSGAHQVRVVLTVQGLPADWCPPAQTLLLPAGNTSNVFLHLAPPLGTPPARYRWSLTAQAEDHPLQAVTTELQVRREPPSIAPAGRPSRRRRRLLITAALLAVIITTGVLVAGHRAPASKIKAQPKAVPKIQPSTEPAPVLVTVTGTILDSEVGRVKVSVVRLTLDDLSDQRHAAVPSQVKAKVTIAGKQWTTNLPAGVYGMTFTQKGCQPASIVVDTTVLRWSPPPWVQLQPVSAQSVSAQSVSAQPVSAEQEGSSG